jgi:hypothetical protein
MKRELMIIAAAVMLALAQLTAPVETVRSTILRDLSVQPQSPGPQNLSGTCCAATVGG